MANDCNEESNHYESFNKEQLLQKLNKITKEIEIIKETKNQQNQRILNILKNQQYLIEQVLAERLFKQPCELYEKYGKNGYNQETLEAVKQKETSNSLDDITRESINEQFTQTNKG
ncbi:hypothetical protein HMPREF1430_00876 [Helicobacter pylori GAM96Ai]|uniref:hypothetical protein n=1 Tax=Helicobacter pylori TaxID=210 RepID=UPI0002B9B722|nr:hypothetical protein [Helicobacter pylori]EMH42833.1 hypothetical protein HMPREF1430_00876 [Helicobacter pylori GAM96Ai]